MKSIGNRRVSQIRKFAVRSASAETENQRLSGASALGSGRPRGANALGSARPRERVPSGADARSRGRSLPRASAPEGFRSPGRPLPRAFAPEGVRGRPLPRASAPEGARSRGRSRERALSGAVLCVPGWSHQFGLAKGAIMAFFTYFFSFRAAREKGILINSVLKKGKFCVFLPKNFRFALRAKREFNNSSTSRAPAWREYPLPSWLASPIRRC